MLIRTLIFDFGNVLGFFDPRLTLRRLVPYTDMTVEEMWEAVNTSALGEGFEGGQISTTEFLTRFRELCRLRCEEEFIASAFADIFTPNEEVCRLIPQLGTRYRLVLASNTNDLHASHFRQQFAGTLQHFSGLVLSHEVKVCKPHRRFYERCRQLAECPPEECLFIDDLPANVEGARACGFQGLVYQPGNFQEQLRIRKVELE